MMAFVALMSTAQTKPASVFLTAGQSNADGRVYVDELPTYLRNGYQYLNYANVTSECNGRFSSRTFEAGTRYAFCDITNYYIEKALQQPFYAVKCTYGGTAIAIGATADKLPVWYAGEPWISENNAYRGDITTGKSLTKSLTEGFAQLVDVTLSKLEQGYDVKAIMWHQGESDRNAANAYYENFKTMIAYMRNAIYEKTGDEADKTLPFIFGTICRNSTQYNAGIEKAQLQVAKDVANVYYIDMSDVTLRSDNLHFDAASTEYLGKMMYNKLVELSLVDGEQVEAVKPTNGGIGDIDVEAERLWDFTKEWSAASVDSIKADATHWVPLKSWGYRLSTAMPKVQELQTATGYVFPETAGLYFNSGSGNRACINPGYNIGLYADNISLTIPQVKPGQYITITTISANGQTERGLTVDAIDEAYLDCIQGGNKSIYKTTNVWWVRDTYTQPVDATFHSEDGGIFIYDIMVTDQSPVAAIPTITNDHTQKNLCFNLMGQRLQSSYKGIVIKEGKKYVML